MKNVEDTSLNREELLENVLLNFNGAVFRIFTEDNCTFGLSYMNERGVDLFDYYRSDLDNFRRFFTSRIYHEDLESFINSLTIAAKSYSCWIFEFRFVKPSGEIYWLYGRANPERYDNRTVYNGILFDITAHKITEERLRLSEDKFSKVFLASPDCIAITRMSDGMIIDVNYGFEKITGWKRGDVINKTSGEIRFWENEQDRINMIEELASGNVIINREVHFRRSNGNLRIGKYTARSVFIPEGHCLIYILQDITENIKMEYKQKKLEQHLFQAQKMEAIGRLSFGIAHDFNNILATILGNTSLMLMKFDENHPDYIRLTRIEEGVKRGAYIVRQLLGFAQGGKYILQKVSINYVLKNSLDFFMETGKEIETRLNLQEDINSVEVDINQIQQVFLNLFINASDAMPNGGILSIKTANVSLGENETEDDTITPGDYVEISISDTGIGMDAGTMNKIFEPFFTTKTDTGGTGLGLASAYGIVHNHKGMIRVFSETGCGSTFTIYLPAYPDNIYEDVKKQSTELAAGNGSVLIIDDEQSILESSSEIIRRLGYTVYTAATGHEAISLFIDKKNLIHVVIVDMVMPGLTGDSVIKILKEINPDIKIILSSGYGLQEDIQELLKNSCHWFLHKPFTSEELSTAVKNVFSNSGNNFSNLAE